MRSRIIRVASWALVAAVLGCGPMPGQEATDLTAGALEASEVTIGPPGKNMNYYRCASDFGTCYVGNGKKYMAYGVNNSYLFKLVGGTVPCVPATFGGDPAVGVVKGCFISNYGTTPSMPSTGLAVEGGTATADGNVAYGANGAFYFKTISGSFTCDSTTFGGDPIFGVVKACYIAAPSYTRVTSEGGVVPSASNRPVAFGAGGRFVYLIGTNTQADTNYTMTCGVGSGGGFPYDPAPGVVKDCYKLTDGHLGTAAVLLEGQQGGTWTTNTNQSTNVFYGSGKNGNFIQTTVAGRTGACDDSAGDPHPGEFKLCWTAPVPGPSQGTWTKLQTDFADTQSSGIESLQLMRDGSVMASASGQFSRWYRLTPGSNGGYANGTWTRLADSALGRRAFPALTLPDGRLFVAGGEYLFDQSGTEFPQVSSLNHSRCEIYNPENNTWTQTVDFPVLIDGGAKYLADGIMAPLPNGKILAGGPGDPSDSMEFDPLHATDTLAWTSREHASVPSGVSDTRFFGEGSFTQLRDGRVFLAENGYALYNSAAAAGLRWGPGIAAPALNPFSGEGGSALTLYSGNVLILGGSSYNALFDVGTSTVRNVARTPEVTPASLNFDGTFAATDEYGQAVMPTGHVLVAAHSFAWFDKFFDYDPVTNSFADVSFGAPAAATETNGTGAVAQTPLADGSVLVAFTGTRSVYVYTPPGPQMTSQGQPTITAITGPSNGVYTMTGTTLSGVTNGANRDDEGSNSTAFPVVSATSGSTTRYCVVTSTSNTSIQPGVASTVKFKAPRAGWPGHGTITIRVSGSGLRSSNSKTISVP